MDGSKDFIQFSSSERAMVLFLAFLFAYAVLFVH